MSNSRDVALEGGAAASELPIGALRPTPHAVVAGWVIAVLGVSVLVMALVGVGLLVSASRLAPAGAASESASTPR